MKKTVLSLLILCFINPLALAEDAKNIMEAVINRNDGTTEVSEVMLSTCYYQKKGNKAACRKAPRVKKMILVRKDYGENEKDHKSVTILLDPPGERGIGFLQYDYEQMGKDTDQWLYLSALKKVKRIVSGNDNEPKTGSFFGTEFSYEDMEKKRLNEFTYVILRTETYQKRMCWVIESTPTQMKRRKSNYSKSVHWVDKERSIILKSILFSRQGKRVKIIYARDIQTINGIIVPRKLIVNNVDIRRRTIMTIQKISLNEPIIDDFLTQRTLTDGAFRSKNLKRYQAHLKE